MTDSDILAYDAAFLVNKLLKEGIADSLEESVALFTEVKRYLLLGHHHPNFEIPMYSRRVDAAWHSFVLFTEEYAQFCQRYFGTFLHHAPYEAPRSKGDLPRTLANFEQFCSAYESMFGESAPDLWRDHTSIVMHRRLMNDAAGALRVKGSGDDATLLTNNGDPLITVNALAAEALQFIAATPHFYVRELPGELTDEEKVGLVEILVEHRILRVG